MAIKGARSFELNAHLLVIHLVPPVQQPAWGRSREFDITTRTVGRNTLTQSTAGDLDEDEDDEVVARDHKKRRVAFEPSPGMLTTIPNLASFPINAPPPETTHTIFYQGHWLRVSSTRQQTHTPLRFTEERLQITRTKRKTEHGSSSELKIRWANTLSPFFDYPSKSGVLTVWNF